MVNAAPPRGPMSGSAARGQIHPILPYGQPAMETSTLRKRGRGCLRGCERGRKSGGPAGRAVVGGLPAAMIGSPRRRDREARPSQPFPFVSRPGPPPHTTTALRGRGAVSARLRRAVCGVRTVTGRGARAVAVAVPSPRAVAVTVRVRVRSRLRSEFRVRSRLRLRSEFRVRSRLRFRSEFRVRSRLRSEFRVRSRARRAAALAWWAGVAAHAGGGSRSIGPGG